VRPVSLQRGQRPNKGFGTKQTKKDFAKNKKRERGKKCTSRAKKFRMIFREQQQKSLQRKPELLL